jgi:hypothetical protein
VNTDTPLPPEEPAGQNPPDGAIINYYLKDDARGPVVLEIFDNNNQLIRRFSSDDKLEPVDEKPYQVPAYWFRAPQPLPAKAGLNRFTWNLMYPEPSAFSHGFPISAIYKNTPLYPLGPAVLPGSYTVKLTVNGKSLSKPLVVKMDPRVKTPTPGLTQQFELSLEAYNGMEQTYKVALESRRLRDQITKLIDKVRRGPLAEALSSLEKKAAGIGGEGRADVSSPGLPGGTIDIRNPNLTSLNSGFSSLIEDLQSADVAPTEATVTAAAELQKTLAKLLQDWADLKSKDVGAINDQLRSANQTLLVP